MRMSFEESVTKYKSHKFYHSGWACWILAVAYIRPNGITVNIKTPAFKDILFSYLKVETMLYLTLSQTSPGFYMSAVQVFF